MTFPVKWLECAMLEVFYLVNRPSSESVWIGPQEIFGDRSEADRAERCNFVSFPDSCF